MAMCVDSAYLKLSRLFEIDPIVVLILGYLDLADIPSVLTVNKAFEEVKQISTIWQEKATEVWNGTIVLPTNSANSVIASYNWTHCYTRLRRWTKMNFNWHGVDHVGDNFPFVYLQRIAIISSMNSAFMYGGSTADHVIDDLRRISFNDSLDSVCPEVTIHKVKTSSTSVPRPRSACSLVCIENKLYIFGGWNHRTIFFNDMWRIDIDKGGDACYTSYDTSHRLSPHARMGHTAVPYEGCMFVFGGTAPGVVFNELLRFDPKTGHWVTLLQDEENTVEPKENTDLHAKWRNGTIEGRGGHASVVIGDWMYVVGGNTVSKTFDDTWRINLRQIQELIGSSGKNTPQHSNLQISLGNSWQKLVPLGPKPLPVIGHSLVPVGNKIIMYGGRDLSAGVFRSGIWMFDCEQSTWRKVNVPLSCPINRTGHAAISHENGILFLGGLKEDNNQVNDHIFLNISSGLFQM